MRARVRACVRVCVCARVHKCIDFNFDSTFNVFGGNKINKCIALRRLNKIKVACGLSINI